VVIFLGRDREQKGSNLDKIIVRNDGGWDYQIDGQLFSYLTALDYLQYKIGFTRYQTEEFLEQLENNLHNNMRI